MVHGGGSFLEMREQTSGTFYTKKKGKTRNGKRTTHQPFAGMTVLSVVKKHHMGTMKEKSI